MDRTSEICMHLKEKRWHSYADGLKKAPKGEAIYTIGEKMPNGRVKYLYAGHSGVVRRRLREHKNHSLAIDQYIKKQYRKNDGENLRVKWELKKNSKLKEGQYIKCLETILDEKLDYNKKKGNRAPSRIKRGQENSMKRLCSANWPYQAWPGTNSRAQPWNLSLFSMFAR